MRIEVLGLLGGSCFAYAAVPTSVKVFKAGKNLDVPISLAWLIFGGTIFMYSYLFLTYGFDKIITFNYFVEASSWATILWYNYFPRRTVL